MDYNEGLDDGDYFDDEFFPKDSDNDQPDPVDYKDFDFENLIEAIFCPDAMDEDDDYDDEDEDDDMDDDDIDEDEADNDPDNAEYLDANGKFDDELYQKSEEYLIKYGHFDKMMDLFYKAAPIDQALAISCTELYLELTPSNEIETSVICYFMFQSHLADIESLSDEDNFHLNELCEQYDFENLFTEIVEMDVMYTVDPDKFDQTKYSELARNVWHIEEFFTIANDYVYVGEQNCLTTQFLLTSLGILHHIDSSPNKELVARNQVLRDEMLETLSEFKKSPPIQDVLVRYNLPRNMPLPSLN